MASSIHGLSPQPALNGTCYVNEEIAMTTTDNKAGEENLFLELLCTPEDEAWRLYATPTRMPVYLRRCFNEQYEAFPVYLDFEDLDRYMKKRGLDVEKHANDFGDVELKARGRAAMELAVWLSKMFASVIRQENGAVDAGHNAPGRTG